MMDRKRIRSSKSEEGIALLISIFVLLLISVVAIALIVSSGTESALAGNYRSSTSVYYAAVAGLEEVRARLRPQGPISFKSTDPGFLPAGTPLAACSPVYVINPVGGENVTPWDAANPYYDGQFNQEFASSCTGAPLPPNPSPRAFSIWNNPPLNGLPFPGPLYKWVRINGVSEKSLNLDVGPTYDGFKDPVTPIYYDGIQLNDQTIGNQVLEVTALAVLPNGSQKIVQYLVAPIPLNLNFPAALTLDGNGVSFAAPGTPNFNVDGNDRVVGSCNPTTTGVPAIGVTNGGDSANVTAAAHPAANYTGPTAMTPNVAAVVLPANFEKPSGLDALVKTITQSADLVITGPVDQTSLPSAMQSPSTPMTIVVAGDPAQPAQGNFNLHGNSTYYGTLVVTGNLDYDPDASWFGIILVIGQGTFTSTRHGVAKLTGAVLLARTLDPSSGFTSLLPDPNLGAASFSQTVEGEGIYYSSCWIKAVMPTAGYKILSFHEIGQ